MQVKFVINVEVALYKFPSYERWSPINGAFVILSYFSVSFSLGTIFPSPRSTNLGDEIY